MVMKEKPNGSLTEEEQNVYFTNWVIKQKYLFSFSSFSSVQALYIQNITMDIRTIWLYGIVIENAMEN